MAKRSAIRVTLDTLRLDPRGLYGPGAPVYKALQRAGRTVTDRAKRNLTASGNVDTGRLRQSGTWKMENVGKKTVTAVVTFDTYYARWVNDGNHGNNLNNAFIYPRRAIFLRFKPKGGSAFVYARRVASYEGSEYLTKALDSVTIGDIAK